MRLRYLQNLQKYSYKFEIEVTTKIEPQEFMIFYSITVKHHN